VIVGDEDRGRFGPPQQVVEVFPHLAGHVRIEVAEGFIQQEDSWFLHQRPGQRDTLLLAAGQLMRIARSEIGQPDHLQHQAYLRRPFISGKLLEPKCHIVLDAQVGEEGVFLEDHADATLFGRNEMARCRHQPAFKTDLAAGHRLKARDGAQCRGLPAPRRAQQADDLAFQRGEGNIGNRRPIRSIDA
jgi:hypothetical protein